MSSKLPTDLVKLAMGILNRWGWSRWPAKAETLKRARVARGKYKCAHCGEIYGPREVEVDHKRPRIDPRTGFVSLDDYVARTFVSVNKLQVLCKPCHYLKSAQENRQREKAK